MKRSNRWHALALAASVAASHGLFVDAQAATRTWTGTTSTLWSAPGNWGGVAPVAGDDLVFPEGAANTTTQNDFAAGTSFRSIVVDGSYAISGNALTLAADNALLFLSTISAATTFDAPITLTSAAAAIATTQADGIPLFVNLGPLTIGGGTLSLAIAGSHARVSIGGIIGETATASIIKGGNGFLNLNANNTYSGQTTVNQGVLVAAANGALGAGTNTTADGTIVNSGASLDLIADIASERVVLNGPGRSGVGTFRANSGATSWGGDIVLNTSDTYFEIGLTAALVLTGRITGGGNFAISGPGSVTITNPLNDYAGSTVIGNPIVNTALVLGASQVVPDASAVSIFANSTLDLNDKFETIASISGAGVININDGHLFLAGGASTTFDGTFVGLGNVDKTGTGILTINGTSTLTPITYSLYNGTVVLNGQIGQDLLLFGPATLAGTGTGFFVAAFAGAGATIAPGPVGSPGLFSTSSLQLLTGNTLAMQLNGATAGAQYDQLAITGGVSLQNCALSATLGFAPAVGSVFRIIDNRSALPVSGTFAGLAEGAAFTVGATRLRISYLGGDGNDVTLTVVPAAPPLAITTSSLGGGVVGITYSGTIAAAGGTPPYAWSVTSGALPTGVTLNPTTGALTGSPMTPGPFNFTVTVTDSAQATASAPLSIVVTAAVAVQPVPTLNSGTLGLLVMLLMALGGVIATRSRAAW